MTFAEAVTKSTGKLRVLAEADIAVLNIQWVNVGAGIYFASAVNLYPTVGTGANLGSAFTVQGWGAIGSVRVDGTPLVRVASLLLITSTATSFYYDSSIRGLYVRLVNHDEPGLHLVRIGVIYGYCTDEFSPINGPGVYEGRLTRNPTVSVSRDPLFYGRIVFRTGSFNLINSDGKFDSYGEDNDIYGNEARIKIGFDSLDYSEYKTVFTGYVTNFSVSETETTFSVADKRKQLTKPIKRTSTNVNALDEIAAILLEAYGFAYDERFFDLTAWAAARAALPTARANITLNMQKSAPVIDVIEDICASVFGQFRYNADNKFTFKIVDTTATSAADIEATDILTTHAIRYDPSEVVSSVRVGYARDWTTTGTQYTYYTDNDREDTVFALYKTYNEKTFDTLLIDEAAAIAFATVVLDYTDTVHGVETIMVPLEHYNRNLGDMINVFVQRGEQPMLGYRKCEVVSIQLGYDTPTMQLGLRYVGNPLDFGLEVYYPLDDDTAGNNTVDDDSGNDNDATKVNYGPVARYQLTIDEKDTSGNGNDAIDPGGINSPTFTEDGAEFDGADDFLQVPAAVYGVVNEAAPWSVTARVNLNTLTPTDASCVVLNLADGATLGFLLDFLKSSGKWRCVAFGASGNIQVDATTDLTDLVATFDGTTLSFYIDGALAGFDASVAPTGIVGDSGAMGGNASAPTTASMDGLIKELRVYDYALSLAEVKAQHARHMSAYEAVDGIASRALSFNGLKQYVSVPSEAYTLFTGDGPLTMALWVNLTTLTPPDGAPQIIRFVSTSGDSAFANISLDKGNGRLQTQASDGTNTAAVVGSAAAAGVPVHVAMVWTGTVLTYYENAVLQGTDTETLSTVSMERGEMGGLLAGNSIAAIFDEVRIYDRALTAGEIKYLYENPVP